MLGRRSVIRDYVYLFSRSILSHFVTGWAEPEHVVLDHDIGRLGIMFNRFLAPSSIHRRLLHCLQLRDCLIPWFCCATDLDL